MFTNIKNFTKFKAICVKGNVEFHTYMITSKKILKRFDATPAHQNKRKHQMSLNLIHCVEILTRTKYPIYRVTFAFGTILAQINHVRFIENIKIYWEKYESHKPTIQCFRCQAHGHTSSSCNKKLVCVKCPWQHDTRFCSKILEIPQTCANCKGAYPPNYSQCSALLAFLAKKTASKETNM